MTENLKSCPFCGGKPYFENEGSDYGFYAVCSRCGCWTGALRTKDESLKRWNNRPIEDEFAEKIKKLEAENKRLREVLEEIKKTVESAQDTVYPFHLALDSKDGVFILETAENALKGNENV